MGEGLERIHKKPEEGEGCCDALSSGHGTAVTPMHSQWQRFHDWALQYSIMYGAGAVFVMYGAGAVFVMYGAGAQQPTPPGEAISSY